MKLVYIAGPFTPTAKQRKEPQAISPFEQLLDNMLLSGDAARSNIGRATALAIRVAESGHMPVCPHSNTGDPRFLSLQTPEFWYAGTLELMRRCDAIALTDDWQESNGACREVIEAHELGMALWIDGEIDRIGLLAHTDACKALRSRGQEP